MAPRKTSLTAKRIAFAREYVKDSNGQQAAIRAGFSPGGARHRAFEMLRDPRVVAEIHKRTERLSAKADVTAERVLRELARLALSDVTAIVQVVPEGVGRGVVRVLPTDTLTADQRAAIQEISEAESGVRVRMHDKARALELLGKHLGLFPTRVEMSGPDGGPIQVAEQMPDAELERIARGG